MQSGTLVSIQSRFDTNGSRFWYTSKVISTQTEINSIQTEAVSKQKWTSRNTCIPVKVFSCFASHMIAIDRKNAIPEGEESCLSGSLETFYTSWIRWTSSLKSAQFKRKSDEPQSGTNRSASLVILSVEILLWFQVSLSFVSNSAWLQFAWNRL